MAKLFTNSGDADQKPHCAVSDLGRHFLPVSFSDVLRLKWVQSVFFLNPISLRACSCGNFICFFYVVVTIMQYIYSVQKGFEHLKS